MSEQMMAPFACLDKAHKPFWYVGDNTGLYGFQSRRQDHVRRAVVCGWCLSFWHTNAPYVRELPMKRHRLRPSESKELVLWCPHLSFTGAEGPVDLLGRSPVLWSCDGCGTTIVEVFEK